MSEGQFDDLPTWQELVTATGWLRAGCPVLHRDHDPQASLRVLLKLVDRLPRYLPIYAYGSDEWRAELARLRALEKDELSQPLGRSRT